MNIISTTLLAGAFAALPGVPTLQLSDLATVSPFAGMTVSAAGVGVEFTGEGVETHAAETTDFVIEVQMKSGSPIRVRL
ncbi:MAG: hypothetical protein AAFP97_03560 [Pseudomonadota bacterium]